ncbi:FAD/NAD(P)-binding protein [Kineococcus rhizosphaerae]|uniref:FAD-NAD(P)-binding protein n=1 Tax=Kineococcus rhizosphaerae TaxID=559628 RepID=A0A2T0R7L1_9ACTN|nr:FAD/NAD(P)-binding protein [Kineococcus rhizosphaerae]PRY17168.1 FAD-NAD(P)-binding protein [Kineococcus rhizosphaerae]
MSLSLLFVGAGPRTLGVLDRLGAHASATGADVDVHVVDPHPAGAGRIWRADQHPLLWMNSRAADVTVLPDASSRLDGPVRTGPTLYAWLDEHRADLVAGFAATGQEALRREVLGVREGTFVSRALGSRYLGWAWERVVTDLPPTVRLHTHRTRVVDVVDQVPGQVTGPARQAVRLEDGTELVVDAVVLAQGHPDVVPGPRERAARAFADRHGLRYVEPGYTSDLGLTEDEDTLRPGADVLVAGMGLAFVDLVVLLTQGRGGRFTDGPDGLVYHPSGREPVLHVGSRRGVPYRSKITYVLDERPPLPRFFTPQALGAHGTLNLRRDLWPLVAKELAGAHYHELFRSHPGRTTGDAPGFDREFAGLPWGSAALDDLVSRAVPDPRDRFDLHRLDRPLDGWWGSSAQEVHRRVHDHVAADVARRADPAYSMDAAVFHALLSCYVTVAGLAHSGRLDPESVVEVDGWWHGLFSYLASGPPPRRLLELLALADAGVVRFLGGDVRIAPDEVGGCWTARSANSPAVVSATTLVDARLPEARITASADPLLRNLTHRGHVSELGNGRLVVDPAQRLVHTDGSVHPRRFGLGPWVAGGGWAAAFARPNLDAGFFRLNDRVAQELLRVAGTGGTDPGTPVSVVAPRAASTAPSRRTEPAR